MSRSGGVLRQDCRRTRAGDTSTSLAGAAARPTLSSLLRTADFVRQRHRRLCGVHSEAACLRHGQHRQPRTSPPCCSLPPHTWRWQLRGAPPPAPGAHDMRVHHSLSPWCRTGLAANSLATSTVGCAHRRSLPGATRIRGGAIGSKTFSPALGSSKVLDAHFPTPLSSHLACCASCNTARGWWRCRWWRWPCPPILQRHWHQTSQTCCSQDAGTDAVP